MEDIRVDAVISDVGDVLIRLGEPAARHRWAARLGLDADGLSGLVWAAIGRRGIADRSVIAGEIAIGAGLGDAAALELLHDFNAHWQADHPLVEALAVLRPRCKVGLLSNAGEAARYAIEDILGVDLADDIVVSSHVGLAKPDVAIYRLAAERLGVDPRRCLFLDDLQDNLDGAVEAGMTAFRHVSTERTLHALAAVLSDSDPGSSSG